MISRDDVLQYESVYDTMTWQEFKQTKLYKLYLKYSVLREFAVIKKNVDDVMAGKISDHMIKCYGFTQHDTRSPWKLYQYLKISLARR